MFQHSRPLHRQTVGENIKLALLPDSLLKLFADPSVEARARAIAERVGLAAVFDRRPATLPFADLRRLELAKAIARDPKVVLVDEPFAGLTAGEVAAFSALIAGFRAEGRAVLLVDHNVKSVAALVDRVLAMYLGEFVAEGSAEQVMANPTVRQVYLGAGSIETVGPAGAGPQARAALAGRAGPERLLRQGAGARRRVDPCAGGGVRLRRRAERRRQDHAVQRHLRPGAVSRPHRLGRRRPGRALRRRHRAAGGIVQCPESRELFGSMSVRENLDLGGAHHPAAVRNRQLDWLFDLFPILKSRATQAAGKMSGGEQQMLAIARALMMQPRLLILDEPTLGLAPVILEQLSRALERLRTTTPITVLLGEQNVTFALPHADRVYVLEHARIVWEGDPARFAQEAGKDFL